MAMIIKDIGEIWTRLFDHRPFLSGEIKFFLREFEEKRSDREVEGLFQVLEEVTEIRDTQIDKVILAAEANLPSLKKSILESVERCNKILEKEEIYRSDTTLQRNRELREAEWLNFVQDMVNKCKRVDETFKEKENDIKDFYIDLQRKLHISSENITSIKDPSVSFKANKKLKLFLKKFKGELKNFEDPIPKNIADLYDHEDVSLKLIDIEWLNSFLKHIRNNDISDFEPISGNFLDGKIKNMLKNKNSLANCGNILNNEKHFDLYLHELLDTSAFVLPRNQIIHRNPILAARIDRLKKDQEERDYKAMTKNIDTTQKFNRDDTLAYQVSMMNRHLIAVGQFIISVTAGFAFGFIGINLLVNDLDFGFRLLLGIACALIIALAEFYFLAKHLSEEEEQTETTGRPIYHLNISKVVKTHKD